MKNKLFVLTKALLKNGSGAELSTKRKRSQYLLIIILLFCFAPLAVSLGHFFAVAYDAMASIDQQGVILNLGIAISSFVIFFFGIFYVINIFYFAEDVENLLPLPLKPFEILGAKFIQVVLYEYLTEAIVMLPMLITYGIKSGGFVAYYLYAVLVFLLVPVVPLTMASILIMILMRFSNLAKNKDRFRIISGVVGIFIGLGLNTWIQRFMGNTMSPGKLQEMLGEGKNSLIRVTSGIFPGSQWASRGLAENAGLTGLANIIIFAALAAVVFLLFLYLGELLYFKGVIGSGQVASKRKAVTREELQKQLVKTPILKSYTLKELKLLFRTPVYFLNCVLMNFLFPFFMLIPLMAQRDALKNMGQVREFLQRGSFASIALAGSFAFLLFVAATNGITATSISREGQNLFINKFIPVSYRDQIMAKVLSGVVLSTAALAILIIVAAVVVGLPGNMILLLIITGLPGILFVAFIGILLDLLNPKLVWDNEQKAVKQNLNVIYSMLIALAFAGLLIFLTMKLKPGLILTAAMLTGGAVILDIILYRLLMTVGVRLFEKLEG